MGEKVRALVGEPGLTQFEFYWSGICLVGHLIEFCVFLVLFLFVLGFSVLFAIC